MKALPARHMAVPGDDPTSDGRTPTSLAYLALCLVLMCLPLVCMSFARTDSSAEKKELAAWPSLVDDGEPNWSYLSDLGSYFNDHFAFRNELVDLDALIKEKLLRTSSTDRVVVGKEGWLFYEGTLNDYQRTNQMSDRAIFNAAHNLALVQSYVQQRGSVFAVAIAPNKNTLYPGYMPAHLLQGEGEGNLDRFIAAASDMGVNVVDLREPLSMSEVPLYYTTDSHWTNVGARIASAVLLDALGQDREGLLESTAIPTGHLGDLALMLRPLSSTAEDDVTYDWALQFDYGEGTSPEDASIVTSSTREGSSGCLVCYRDSFGNALVPFLASAYKSAFFSKLMPYDMGLVAHYKADAVLMERAERHLSTFATTPPYLYSPRLSTPTEVLEASDGMDMLMTARVNGPYLQLGGYVDDAALEPQSRIFVALQRDGMDAGTYECFLVSSQAEEVSDVDGAGEPGADEVQGDGGFRAFLPATSFTDDAADVFVSLLVEVDGKLVCVSRQALSELLIGA